MADSLVSASEVWFFGSVDVNVFAAWGQVIGAAGTLLAVLVAVWISIRDGRYRDVERRDNEAALARLVSGARVSDPPRLTVSYTNYGPSPVTSVRLVDMYGSCGGIRSVGWSIDGSSDEYVLAAIGPGKTVTTPPITVEWPADADVDEVAALYYPTVVFFDANGRWWERVGHDQPQRLLSPPRRISRLPVRKTAQDEDDDRWTRLH